jgi:hypothetical protein
VLGTIGGSIVSTPVELPALDGRLPLGFLAALGLLTLINESLPGPARLSFTPERGTAVIHSDYKTPAEVAARLAATVSATPGTAVIPGLTHGFPRQAGTGPDPMRHPRDTHRQFARELSDDDPRAAAQWLPRLITDLATDNSGKAAITPFMAPRGQQKMRSFFEKPLDLVRHKPEYLTEALTGWRRVPGVTGEYLDHAALNAPVDDPAGKPGQERGVPGATWLATMAVPMLRLTGNGRDRAATLWHQAGERNFMIWPLWDQPLDPPAVQALIEHPALVPVGPAPAVSSAHWETLGINGVHGAERQKLPGIDKCEGVLVPVQVLAVP